LQQLLEWFLRLNFGLDVLQQLRCRNLRSIGGLAELYELPGGDSRRFDWFLVIGVLHQLFKWFLLGFWRKHMHFLRVWLYF